MKSPCLPLALLALVFVFDARVRADDEEIDTSALYPVSLGTQWDYVVEIKGVPNSKISNKISKIETIDDKKLVRLESFVQKKVAASEHIAVEEDGIYRHRMNGFEATPPICLVKFPVKDEETWDLKSKVGEESLTGDCTVKLEEITVPAGTFKTVRVTMNAKAGAQELSSTVWYAEKHGMVQQTIAVNGQEFTLKLEKFTAGKE